MKIAVMVLLLAAAGLSLANWQGSGRPKNILRSSQGTIERRFSKSSSYDTKEFEVKHAGDYRFDLDWEMAEGYMTVTLWYDNRIQGSWSGRQLRESLVLDLEQGEHTIAIAAEGAQNGSFLVRYEAL